MENNSQEMNTAKKRNNDENQINSNNAKGLVAHGGTNYFADNINIANQPIPIERERLEKRINQINDEFINKEKDRKKRKEKEEDNIKENFQKDVEEIEKETEEYEEILAKKLCYDLSVLLREVHEVNLDESYHNYDESYYEFTCDYIESEKEELYNLINTLQLCISSLEPNHVIKEFHELNIQALQHQVREIIYDYYESWHENLSKQKESISRQEQKRDSDLEKCQGKLESDIKKLHDNKYDKFKHIYQKECSYKLKYYPLTHPSNKEYFEQLKKLKGYLDIKDEDANRIHNTIVQEVYRNNLKKYQQDFLQKIEQFPYPLSNQIRQELKSLQQSLGLEDEDVELIEKPIEQKPYQANLQKYKREFLEKIKQEPYPLSNKTLEILKSLQQSLGLKNEDIDKIKKPIEQKAYEKNLQKYRTAFSLRINQEGCPLSNQTREKLKSAQQRLGLKDKDIKAIERIIEEEAYQEKLQLYRNEFLQIVKKEAYPFSNKIHEELKSKQQSLGLKDEDIKSIEQPIKEQAYRNNLQVYGKEFSEKINQASNNLNNINREELKLRQEFLGLKNEADVKVVESIVFKFRNIDSSLIFRNEQQIDFWELRDLLAAGEWEKADDWTRKTIVHIANRSKEGYLDKQSIKSFPIKDIFTINQIWVIYSQGRFGFSVQKKIFDSVKQNKDDFAKKVGWKENKAFASSWKDYDKLRFGIDALQGHLPAWGVKFNHNIVGFTSNFINKISGKNSDISNHNIFGDDFSYLFSLFDENKLENASPESNNQSLVSSISSSEKNIAVAKNNSNENYREEQAMNIKNFNILTLGASGSGKTVLLASLFKKLYIQEDSTFKLVVRDAKQRKLLNSIYTQIISEDTWPPGTKNIFEWTFDCCVQTQELEDYTACQFTYFDYAGGRLIDGEDQKFEKVVEQADAILGLLDGRKIHAWLEDSNQILVNEFLDKDLPNILKRIQTSKVPVHFVISKWDLLDRDGHSLSEVKERLLNILEFAELLEARSRFGSPVRLIPISAVGLDFASLQSDGSMKKNPGVKPMPFLVESPLACVLPDKFQQLIKESEAKQEKIEKKAKNRSGNTNNSINYLNILGAGLGTMKLLIQVASILSGTGAIDIFMIEGFVNLFNHKDTNQYVKVASAANNFFKGNLPGLSRAITNMSQSRREQTLQFVKNEQSALAHAIGVFHEFKEELEEMFTDSTLV